MIILFVKLYRNHVQESGYYNSQELGLAKAFLEISEKRNHVTILQLQKGGTKKCDKVDNVDIVTIPAKGIGHHGYLNPKVIDEFKPDVVHILADNMLFAPNVIKYCQKNGIQYHLYIGTLFTDSPKRYKRAFNKLLMKRNIDSYRQSRVFVKTPAVRDECKQLGIEATLAPVGLRDEQTVLSDKSIEDIRKKYDLPQDSKILLFVGRLEEYKHPLEALEVLDRLARNSGTQTPGYHLLMVGQGSLKSALDKRIAELGLYSSITHINKIPNSEMKDLYKACDYYINFNPDEIYGMAILEAMCHKCPVLAIKAPGPNFLIDDGKTGYLCTSSEEMAEKVALLSKNEALYESMQDQGRAKVLDHLTWKKTARIFDDCI